MVITKILTNFKRLNTKIVIYFLFFAFLPLLVFSILGYYVNKDLITRINLDYLRSLNSSCARELSLYLDYKDRVIKHVLIDFRNSEKTTSLQVFLNENDRLKSDFTKLVVFDSNETRIIPLKNEYQSIIDSLPAIDFRRSGIHIKGYVPIAQIGTFLNSNVKEIQNSVYFLNSEKKLTITTFKTCDIKEIEAIKQYSEESDTYIKMGIIEESEFLFSYTKLTNKNMIIVTKVDSNTFYTELISFRNKILFANFIIALILTTLTIIYSRRITTPLHKLIEASQHIGRGNLDKKIELKTNDEIETLANEFELMRKKLQESYQGMEEKIQKRTRELQEAQAQISHQEKMASLGMMAAGIAHEIGNPLTSISSMAQVIKRRSDNDKINGYVSNILKSIERISRIVRELVDFSRPSSHEEALCDINEIIQSAVGIIKYDRRSKNLLYNLSLDPDLPKTVLVSDHILQVFLNILINAIDACDGFGNDIAVKSFSKNGSIYVDISDKGCGIPSEIQNKIFEPFFTTKEVGKGTGLGLTVSYGFIKKLNGEIKVKSELDKGSMFSIILPIRSQIED